MEAVAIVTVLALMQYEYFGIQVGAMRGKHGVDAPAITGNPEFERMFRVQQNTLEQLVAFLPGLWLFGYYLHSLTAAGIGVVFIIGRFIYRGGYLKDPASRGTGFGISFIATAVLLLGGLIGAVLKY